MSKRKFGIYIPSYKRAATISTHKLLEYYKVVVRKSEETEYLKVIPKENLIAVPDEEINNIVKVVNWIVDNSEEDAIAMIRKRLSPRSCLQCVWMVSQMPTLMQCMTLL